MEKASNPSKANPADVSSIDAIIAATYDVISGPAGQARNWERERSLFLPGARLIPTSAKTGGNPPAGKLEPQVYDVEGFIERSREYVEKNGFYEKEIARRTEQFGSIAHVWSTYESRYREDDLQPFMRGINSIQLFFDGDRWWVMSIYWQQEGPTASIPESYLTSPGRKK